MRAKKNRSKYIHRKFIKRGFGYNHKNLFIKTKQTVIKSLTHNFTSRINKKKIYKNFFIKKINFYISKYNFKYNFFIFFIKNLIKLSFKEIYFFIIFDVKIFFKIINAFKFRKDFKFKFF